MQLHQAMEREGKCNVKFSASCIERSYLTLSSAAAAHDFQGQRLDRNLNAAVFLDPLS